MMCIARNMPSKKTSSNDTMAKKSTQKVERSPEVQTAAPVAAEQVQTTPAPAVPKKLRVKKEPVQTSAAVESASAPESAPVTVAAAEIAATEVQTKKPRKKVEKKAVAAPLELAPVEVAAPVEVKTEAVVSTPASEQSAVSETSESASVQSIFESLIAQNESLLTVQKNLVLSLKKAYKAFEKQAKDAEKKRSRRTTDPDKKRQPSGFLMPTAISDTLCDFLGVPHGSKVSRTAVTNQINTYIREHSLHVPDNKRSFVPDAKLSVVFGPLHEKDNEVGFCYFNLQRYLKPHFVSSSAETATATATA